MKKKRIAIILSAILVVLLIIIGVGVYSDMAEEGTGISIFGENKEKEESEEANNGGDTEEGEEAERFEKPDNYVEADKVYETQTQKEAEEKELEERIEQAEQNDGAMVLVSNTQAKPGDTVTLTANLVNNPGILGMTLSLSYDDSVMELVSAKSGSAFDQVLSMTHSKTLGNGCVFLWDGESVDEKDVKDGEILILEFKIADSAAAKKTPVKLISTIGGTVDSKLKEIEVVTESGYIVIGE